jgi:hypothetical protein
MVQRIRAAELFLTLSSALWSAPAFAQSNAAQMTLTVAAGRPLDILLDQRVVIKTVGQPVTGTLVQPLYAYDRVVVPAGTRVIGHVEAFRRFSGMLSTATPQCTASGYLRARTGGMQKAAKLDEITARTGGVAYYPSDVDQIDAAALTIARQIRQQYTIGYTPTNAALDGTYRAIEVRAISRNRSERLRVRTRAGYRPEAASSR